MQNLLQKYRLSVIAICLVISLVAGSIVSYTTLYRGRATQGTIQLSFDGIESGKAPDGSSFRRSQIKNNEVLKQVITKLNLDLTPEELGKHITIVSMIPEEVAAQLKTTKQSNYTPLYEFVPNEYQISIGADSGIKSSDAKLIIETLVAEYTNYFHKKYSSKEVGSVLNIGKDFEDYDYMDAVKVIKSRLELLKSSSDNMVQRAGYFKSAEDNLSFEDISNTTNDMINVDLVSVDLLINVYSLSKDTEKLLGILEHRINTADHSINENSELSIANLEMLRMVSADTNTDYSVITEVMKSQTFMSSLLSSAVKNSYYSYVVKKLVDANVAVERGTTEKEYYQNQVNKILSNTSKPTQIQWATNEVDRDLENITEKMNQLYEKYNNLYDEYLETQISDTINLSGQIGLTGVSKLYLLVILGGFGCVGLAAGLLFGKKKKIAV